MSVTLATIADALIEFILSLLRDPEAQAEFDQDPEAALASRGLSNVSAADVCMVAPVVAEQAGVAPAAVAVARTAPPEPDSGVSPVVRQISEVTNSLTYVNNQNTLVDQSVNQNIWADGDVTQTFDQEAVVASGTDSIAAGDDVDQDTDIDNSTDIDAGDDVLVDSENTETETTDSGNTTTQTSTETDSSTEATATDSGNTITETTTTDDSYNTETVEVSADDSSDATFEETEVPLDDAAGDDGF